MATYRRAHASFLFAQALQADHIQFCIAFGGGSYIAAAWYTNADTAKWAERLGSGRWWRRGQEQPTDREIARAKQGAAAKATSTTLSIFQRS